MDSINKILGSLLLFTLTVFSGFTAYFGKVQVEGQQALTSKTADIEVKLTKQYSEQGAYQDFIGNELTYIKKDVGSIREVQKKYAADVSSNTKKIDRMCTSMEYYWDKTNCK